MWRVARMSRGTVHHDLSVGEESSSGCPAVLFLLHGCQQCLLDPRAPSGQHGRLVVPTSSLFIRQCVLCSDCHLSHSPTSSLTTEGKASASDPAQPLEAPWQWARRARGASRGRGLSDRRPQEEVEFVGGERRVGWVEDLPSSASQTGGLRALFAPHVCFVFLT